MMEEIMKRIMLVALLVGLSASALVAQEAEKPNDAKKTEKPKLLEMKKVLELVEKYRHAVYRADMEELALKLEEQLAPRAEEILETLKIDKTGRVAIPVQFLAEIGGPKKVMVVGALNFMEIWSLEEYRKGAGEMDKAFLDSGFEY